MRFSTWAVVAITATMIGFCPREVGAQQQNVENVILVTMDGLRWQELFGGADQRLINKEDGNVDKPKLTREKFWRDDPLGPSTRRQVLMPFFWNIVAKQGQVFGSPDHDSKIIVKNGHNFSYPGYNELLAGFGDAKIDSNAKVLNKNVTVLEWLNRMPEFTGRVAAFCSWDVFPFIINDERSGIPVNAGWMPLEHFEDEVSQQAYNDLTHQLPKYWQSVRYDAFTFRGALEYMKTKKPRVIYLALGETDDWAHAGRYDLYLESARQNDDFIRQLWEYAQSSEQYRGKTALVIATDHGRGDDRVGWKSHGAKIPGCDRIWIGVLGPNVGGLGLRKKFNGSQGQVASTVASLLGHDFTKFDKRIEPPLNFTESGLGQNLKATATPLPRAHAHNDYRHDRPLFDALDRGFCSVEADIFLVDGELRVGHSRIELKQGRTLESLYLDPLKELVSRNQVKDKSEARVYLDGPVFTLMVDIKTDGEAVYQHLQKVLVKYHEVLCRVEDGKYVERAIQIVISGDRPIATITGQETRYVGIDGRLGDLDSDLPAHAMPMISDHWGRNFKWRGTGAMPDDEREKLRSIVRRAHGKGRRVRFWATPESPVVWQLLLDEGVDHINTDQLDKLKSMMKQRPDRKFF